MHAHGGLLVLVLSCWQSDHGRLFFENLIRENLDLGRPEQIELIFNRKITNRTPGRFRTRVVTQDVTPSEIAPTEAIETNSPQETTHAALRSP